MKGKNKEVKPNEDVTKIKIERDSLATILAKSINSQFKGFTAAHFLDGVDEEQAATEVTDWISTGDDILDIKISNRPHGGIPVGKISEITGLQSTGKSLMVSHLIAETQKKGGIAILYDTEFAASPEFLQAIGVNTSNLVYIQLETLEDIFSSIEKSIMDIREKNQDKLVLICVDSIMGATTKTELEADWDKEGYDTGKSRIMGKAMRKIVSLIAKQKIALVCTNQLREKLGVMFGDKYTTAGGKALGFAASVGLRLGKLNEIKVGNDAAGINIKIKVTKNRIGPPLRTTTLSIYFDRGIDRFGSWLTALKDLDLAEVGKFIAIKSLKLEIPKKDWNKTLTERVDVREQIYQLLCDTLIMKYVPNATETLDGEISSEE